MANRDQPQGARPLGEARRVQEYTAGAEVFPGDFVHLEADGLVDPSVVAENILGVALDHATASGQLLKVSVDPEQIYVIQADGSDVDAQTDIGNTFEILATAGDTTYNQSRMEVDSSTFGTSTQQLVLIGIDNRDDNALGAQVDCLIKINESQLYGENGFAGI